MELPNEKNVASASNSMAKAQTVFECEMAVALQTTDGLEKNEIQWGNEAGNRFAFRRDNVISWCATGRKNNQANSLSLNGDSVVFHRWNEYSPRELCAAVCGYHIKIVGRKEDAKSSGLPFDKLVNPIRQIGFFEEPSKQNFQSLVWSGERSYFLTTAKLVWQSFANGVLKPFDPKIEDGTRLAKVLYNASKKMVGIVSEKETVGSSNQLVIYSAHDLKKITTLPLDLSDSCQLDFHPSGEEMIYVNAANELCFYGLKNDKVSKFSVAEGKGKKVTFSYPEGGKLYATADSAGMVKIWDKQSHALCGQVNTAYLDILAAMGPRFLLLKKIW
jgi:WD40 repeat protein